MYKLCLVLIGFVFAGPAIAQKSAYAQYEPSFGSGSIQIAVSTLDDADGDTYFEEAEKSEKSGELDDALTFFGRAAFEYNSAGNPSRYGASLLRLSHIHFLMEHYTEAEQVILNVALKTYSRLGSRTGQMASYNQLGKIYLAANKLTQSLWFYSQQGILAKQTNNSSSYIDSMLGIVHVKIRKKEFSMASKDITRAELFARNSKNNQFKGQIRQAKNAIAEKRTVVN
ncbi:hypothetical protein ACSBL2_00970 [Pedobacter sp. AW31-3R]|uniref:hypothetical protein n=1 Tax=Pedobacter sp. AW31-3R TaxID=3445781 RepID=UPI003FA04E06